MKALFLILCFLFIGGEVYSFLLLLQGLNIFTLPFLITIKHHPILTPLFMMAVFSAATILAMFFVMSADDVVDVGHENDMLGSDV